MAIRVALNHRTEYRYDRLVTLAPQVVRLRPTPHCRTPVVSYALRITPDEHFINWQQDPYSNYWARLVFPRPTRSFRVEVDLVAEMTVTNPFDFFLEPSAERYPFVYEPVLAKELIPYLETEPAGPRLRALVEELRQGDVRTVDYLVAINARLSREIAYLIRMEPGIQACEETLTLGSGSCRDSAWLLVQVLRHLGLAARFVSGYLIQLKPDTRPLEGPAGPEADFTDLHAWAEVYVPGAGWIGLDATSGLLAGEGHIPLACTADPQSAAPIAGSFGWNGEATRPDDACVPEFAFDMKVTRIHEDPRVTRPYRDAQWRTIVALGRRIDERLRAGDVRLTMGGEPTFVSVDDREGDEWTVSALGPTKRPLAGRLLSRLRDRFAPGGLLHHGQGSWYPGESLPRWALSCHWRRDGVRVWEDPALCADESRSYGFGEAHARRFAEALIDRLGLDPAHCLPGYEDLWYYLWRERRLPVNVDVLESRLEDPEERARLAKVFEQGLNRVIGLAVPLRRDYDRDEPRWVSGPWSLRREHLFLTPGDSPMGYRLPLDALPWATPGDTVTTYERDPFAPRGPLPPRAEFARRPRVIAPTRAAAADRDRPGPDGPDRDHEARRVPRAGRSFPGVVRTALCVEPREGRLYIFMPPQDLLEDYLDLVSAVEQTAAELRTPVLVEGYPPPHDHRMNAFKITPDPGVIEVNIHPSNDWDELVERTTTLYEEARRTGLGTEKFMLDGRHTGTGGGNHVVIGGPTPADSPILRRPDLLRSLVAYWHNHPSLSYLFSGLFIGPTSQAPRVDDARNDSLYELEIAFRQIPERPRGGSPPWLVDRVFRNLLVDVTGSTHRAEFCIDKLYAPDTSRGRQGLLEMRAFEMPPHARMSLVQQLLIRGLIARFWDEPYDPRLVRWGTELHDRFVLPHFVRQDFHDVLEELQSSGVPLEVDWFAPHFEFRFPQCGSFGSRDVLVELRQAIEPWHVLGEEAATGAAARYVDSSVERLQVKVQGMTDSRHVLTCNGRPVPLHPTGTNGEFVAGVRYRAWQPPSCLHPNIPVHAPLVFDLVDTWMGRSTGGCTYHVSHPGGRSFETFPVNASEAESRRAARFFRFGHTPGPMTVPHEERNPEAPLTLDLRRPPRLV
jgi:uncharacterized protein (DUF2126 family)/transglutaminase-like putative cysteine protease